MSDWLQNSVSNSRNDIFQVFTHILRSICTLKQLLFDEKMTHAHEAKLRMRLFAHVHTFCCDLLNFILKWHYFEFTELFLLLSLASLICLDTFVLIALEKNSLLHQRTSCWLVHLVHSLGSNFNIQCSKDSCARTFMNFRTYQNHLLSHNNWDEDHLLTPQHYDADINSSEAT